MVKNLIAVYDDGTSEVRSTRTYTKYNRENYNATSDELREESTLMTTQNMAYYEEVLSLVNEIRAEAGVEPLTLDTTLCQAATVRTLEMDYSGYYSHTRPDGSSCFTILTYYGFAGCNCGENIAAGQTSPAYVVAAWKRSQGHYENMINPNYTKMGVGYSGLGVGEYRHYWCQLFVK